MKKEMTKKQMEERINDIYYNHIMKMDPEKRIEFSLCKNNILKGLGIEHQYIRSNIRKDELIQHMYAYEIAWDCLY